MLFRHQSEAQTGLAITDDRDAVDIKRRSADAATVKLGSTHARADAFDYERPFELCHRRDDHDNGAAQRAVRVDRLALGQELDAEVVQFIEYLEEVLGTPGEAVTRPDKDDIKTTTVGIIQKPV